jgi:excisionase family DNA binding protein
MSRGLYTVAEIARYFGTRPQEVARMIQDDGLPAVKLPGEKKLVRKVTLHGLHAWMSERHDGAAFMSVEALAAEIEAAQAGSGVTSMTAVTGVTDVGLTHLRAVFDRVFEGVKHELERKKAA